MNLFFYIVNNIIMKKIVFLILFIFNINYVLAIEDIEINNEYLIPKFDKDTSIYNYYTSNDKVNISIKKDNNENVFNDGIHYLNQGKNIIEITSSNNEKYIINVFKDYKKNNDKGYLEYLYIEGYDINFNSDVFEYFIHLNNEEYLNIDYKLSNDNTTFSISGNGNFNDSDNIIKISINDNEYIIHALKTINVSYIEEDNKNNDQKKEIVILLIISISCILVFIYFYSLFIFN